MVRLFEPDNLVHPVVNNKRRIATATITPPETRKKRRVSSFPPNVISSESFDATFVSREVEFIEVPEILESLETYAYIGFDDATAQNIWDTYLNYVEHADPDDTEGEFFDFARYRIENVHFDNPITANDDWLGYMNKVGVSKELQEAIMLPEFSEFRYTGSCEFWLLETMECRFQGLHTIDNRLRAAAALRHSQWRASHPSTIRHTAHTPTLAQPSSRSKIGGSSSGKVTLPEEVPQWLHGESLAQPLSPEEYSIETDPHPLQDEEASPGAELEPVTAPSSITGCTMLWRAGSKRKAESFYNTQTKEISFPAIASWPGDFGGNTRVVYWTPQKETADKYAAWLKLRCHADEICMIQVAVPEAFTNTLATKHLWFDERGQPTDEWKKVVRSSRREGHFPEELEYLYQKDLLVGHMLSGRNCKYTAMPDHTRIRDSDLLTVRILGEERKGVQWVFHTRRAEEGFIENCKDKIWLHSLGAQDKPLRQK